MENYSEALKNAAPGAAFQTAASYVEQLERFRPPKEEVPQGDPPDVVAAGGEKLRLVREHAIDTMAPPWNDSIENRLFRWFGWSLGSGFIGFFAMVIVFGVWIDGPQGPQDPNVEFPVLFFLSFVISQIGGIMWPRSIKQAREKRRAELRALDSIKLAAVCAAWQRRREMDYQASAIAREMSR